MELFITILVIVGIVLFVRGRQKRKREQEIQSIILTHATTLGRKRQQLLFTDDYGTVIGTQWEKEKSYFINTVMVPRLSHIDLSPYRNDIYMWVEQAAIAHTIPASELTRTVPADPIEYERFCAALLNEAGWTTHLTKTVGDQGADVIAEKDSRRLVLQCKLYSKPVGNKAVQEVIAARSYEKADFAAVVSNADFTPAARRLAANSDVLLLHHTELTSLTDPGAVRPNYSSHNRPPTGANRPLH